MNRRNGFSLVELTVIVMILGIIAAIAVPKVVQALATADQKAVEHSAAVVRDAITFYAARHDGRLPGQAGTPDDLKNDLAPYLRKFPVNTRMKSAEVRVQTTGEPLDRARGGTAGWLYDNQSGEFIPNAEATAATAPTSETAMTAPGPLPSP